MFWSNYLENSLVTTLARVHAFHRFRRGGSGGGGWQRGQEYTCVRRTSDDNKAVGGNSRGTSVEAATEVFAAFPWRPPEESFLQANYRHSLFECRKFSFMTDIHPRRSRPARSLSPFHLELLNYTHLINVAGTLYRGGEPLYYSC